MPVDSVSAGRNTQHSVNAQLEFKKSVLCSTC